MNSKNYSVIVWEKYWVFQIFVIEVRVDLFQLFDGFYFLTNGCKDSFIKLFLPDSLDIILNSYNSYFMSNIMIGNGPINLTNTFSIFIGESVNVYYNLILLIYWDSLSSVCENNQFVGLIFDVCKCSHWVGISIYSIFLNCRKLVVWSGVYFSFHYKISICIMIKLFIRVRDVWGYFYEVIFNDVRLGSEFSVNVK